MDLLRLRDLMKEKEVTGVALAEATGVTAVSISNIVQGNSFPKPELLLKIADYLDVDIRELFRPTKQLVLGELNGFVEYKGEVYKITTVADLEDLIIQLK